MSNQHTPGQWKFSQETNDPEWFIVTTNHGVIVANVNANKTQEANARLIAAAPELLEALEGMVAYINSLETIPCISRAMQDVGKAKAAISKAKGE
jgi:hypothetical protein